MSNVMEHSLLHFTAFPAHLRQVIDLFKLKSNLHNQRDMEKERATARTGEFKEFGLLGAGFFTVCALEIVVR